MRSGIESRETGGTGGPEPGTDGTFPHFRAGGTDGCPMFARVRANVGCFSTRSRIRSPLSPHFSSRRAAVLLLTSTSSRTKTGGQTETEETAERFHISERVAQTGAPCSPRRSGERGMLQHKVSNSHSAISSFLLPARCSSPVDIHIVTGKCSSRHVPQLRARSRISYRHHLRTPHFHSARYGRVGTPSRLAHCRHKPSRLYGLNRRRNNFQLLLSLKSSPINVPQLQIAQVPLDSSVALFSAGSRERSSPPPEANPSSPAPYSARSAESQEFAGYQLRTRLVKALKCPDFVIAILEDATAIAGGLLIASRF